MAVINSIVKDIIRPIINDVISVDFLPSDLLDLHLWLDSSQLSTVIESGTEISKWNDRRDNGKFADQTTGSSQPTLVLNAINGLPAIDFDGSNDNLTTTFSFDPSATDFTIFMVARIDDDGTTQTMFSQQNGGGLGRTILQTITSDVFLSNLGGTPSLGPTISFIPEIYTLKVENDNLDLSISGGTLSSFSNIGIEAANGDWVIGAAKTLGGPHNGLISEIIIYDRALSDSDDGLINQYLSGKWGITLS